MSARRLTLVLTLLALLIPAGAAQAATIWTPINSNTTDTISSIVYQSPTRFWYATTNGKIEYFNGSSFIAGLNSPGENFTDLAFQPPDGVSGPGTAGLYGYAVTSLGHVWQTSNGGVSWTQLLTATLNTRHDCSAGSPAEPVSELNGVVWASSSVVYLLGDNSTVQKSSAGNSATPGFAEINKNGSGTCAVQSESSTRNMNDATFLPANPLDGFIISQDFGALYASSNGFTSGIKKTDMVNNFQGNPRLAMDTGNPNRLWAADHNSGGAGCGELCLQVTTDGGVTAAHVTFPNDTNPTVGLYDVSSQGGVEVTAGSGGEIFNSVDGVNFYLNPAGGALATENWRAEDAFDAAHAAVGGENGALAVTAAANTIPDIIAPTGTISGPTTVTSGTPATYTAAVADNAGGSGINPAGYTWTVPGFPAQHGASASYTFPKNAGSATITLTFTDNAGNQGTATLNVTVNNAPPVHRRAPSGSQPTTISTGGATITIYKIVFVTGRNARFVPVNVSASTGRKLVATVLKGKKKLATGAIKFKRKGHGSLHVKLSGKVKPGTYTIVVRVFTPKGKHVGRQVSIKFKLV
jgi:hypothetical protein